MEINPAKNFVEVNPKSLVSTNVCWHQRKQRFYIVLQSLGFNLKKMW